MGGESSRGPMMTRVCWRLVDISSRILDPSEREAVRGDLVESGETSSQALREVLGLVVRRQAALWTHCRRELRLYLDVREQLGMGRPWECRVLACISRDRRACLHEVLNAGLLVMDEWFCARVRIARHHSGQRRSALSHVVVRSTSGCTPVSCLFFAVSTPCVRLPLPTRSQRSGFCA